MTGIGKMQNTEVGEDQEEFLELCNKVKAMTEEERNRKRKHDDQRDSGEGSQGRGGANKPSLVYGPIDWTVNQKEKVVEAEAGGGECEQMSADVPKKKSGKIKRRGKKKGKRKKPDREEDTGENAPVNPMEC